MRARIKPGEIAPHDRKRLHEVYERVRLRMGGPSVHSVPYGLAIVSLFVGFNMLIRPLSRGFSVVDSIFAVVFAALIIWIWTANILRRRYILPGPTIPGDIDEVAKCWLAERHCPSCLYDLTQTDPADDGLTRCPECAHQWRIGGATTIPRGGST